MNEAAEQIFRDGSVAGGAGRLQWQAAGHGDLVVDLVFGTPPTRFHSLLAQRFHVATLDVSNLGANSSGDLTVAVGALVAASGHDRCSLVVRGAALPLVLPALRARPGLVDALALLAPLPPCDIGLLDALSAAELPLLVLSGTRGSASPPEAGSRFRAQIRGCHYVLVYDAGDMIEIDRPEAAASVVGDFLMRRERFIVAHASGLIHP